MSLLAATQIPKPADEQAFERACVPLWIGLLNDPTVTRNGRRGQRQKGVDLIGMRNGSPAHYVGIQCKLKSDGKGLDEDEVRGEVEKALTFKPALREYYIVTTAPDDVAMQELARIITLKLHEKGTNLLVFVWGWNTLEEKIFQDSKARNAFDPDYGAFSEQILENTDHLLVQQTEISEGLSEISAKMDLLQGRVLSQPGDGTVSVELYEKGLDAEIDGYRELNNSGKPTTAMRLLQALLTRVRDNASGRLLFRIKANIGSCYLRLGDERKAGNLLAEAFEHAREEPKAIANKAFALLLQGRPLDALAFAKSALADDPTNDQVAGVLVQSARFDDLVDDPLVLVPSDLHQTSAGQTYSFLIEEGDNRPGENILSPVHPMAAAALGLKAKDSFSLKNGFGDSIEWQVIEIKHKYLHALHVMMANFEHRFPDVKGFYSITMREGDIQPALEQVKRFGESNENFADFYIKHHLPMAALASVMGRDTIGLADYIRSVGHDLAVCVGNDPERYQAREFIVARRAAGAVLDTYTAWTAATTDTFDILIDVFGKLVVAQSSIDEIRALVEEDKQLGSGRSMTVAYQNGQFIRQELTAADRASRRTFIGEQLKRIESSCKVLAPVAPNDPTELATALTDNFGTDVLDAVNIAKQGYVLLSEDLYYRQVAEEAAGVSGVWLQSVFAFARDTEILDAERYADLAVKMAWRRHSHVSIESGVLVDALQGDTSPDLINFRALTRYIGTKDAEMRSHVSVVIGFLNQIWTAEAKVSTRTMAATGILLEQLVRFRPDDWNIPLGLISYQAVPELANYFRGWTAGHFLSGEALTSAEREVTRMSGRVEIQHFIRRRRGARSTTRWPRS